MQPGCLDLHQRDQAEDLGLVGHEPGEDPAEAQGILAELRSNPVGAGGRGIALVEHEVDHLEDRGEASVEVRALGNLERHPGLGQRSLRPDDPLGDRRLGDQERPGDLVGPQAAEEPQRERDPRSTDSTGWQQMKTRRRRSSPMAALSIAASRSGGVSCSISSSRPSSCDLRSSVADRRNVSIARCLAVPINHAPGLSGTPDSGHCCRAATRASWARSSASPTSRTMRVKPAMSRGDSIRHTASIVRWTTSPRLPATRPAL